MIFRKLFTDGNDEAIYANIARYFAAVRDRWPDAWEETTKGNSILVKTTGFLALCRFLRDVYSKSQGDLLDRSYCLNIFDKVELKDKDLVADNFPSGSVGQRQLYDRLKADTGF